MMRGLLFFLMLLGCGTMPDEPIATPDLELETPLIDDPYVPPDPVQIPAITSVTPPYGISGLAYPVMLTLVGERFVSFGNVVTVTPIAPTPAPITTIVWPSIDGTTIVVPLPKCVWFGFHCFVLGPGKYSITVTTPDGTSDPAAFRLCEVDDPRCPPRRTFP